MSFSVNPKEGTVLPDRTGSNYSVVSSKKTIPRRFYEKEYALLHAGSKDTKEVVGGGWGDHFPKVMCH